MCVSPGTTILDAEAVRAALAPAATAWLRNLRVHLVIDSTNSRMADAARTRSIDGLCWFAELQTAGRGPGAAGTGSAPLHETSP